MSVREHTILVISDNPSFCASARRELQCDDPCLRVASVSNVDAAQLIVEDTTPSVIMLEQTALTECSGNARARAPRLEAVVSSLAAYAPVVVLGNQESAPELCALVAAGAADYVGSSPQSLEKAAEYVKGRLQQAKRIAATAPSTEDFAEVGDTPKAQEDFGEILRHELNNPLTGILGNAELLLVELRRRNDGHIPQGGVQRLETIAALAVRMRETIRRLSQEWEARRDLLRTP
jgi:signal transduction histidine kinase